MDLKGSVTIIRYCQICFSQYKKLKRKCLETKGQICRSKVFVTIGAVRAKFNCIFVAHVTNVDIYRQGCNQRMVLYHTYNLKHHSNVLQMQICLRVANLLDSIIRFVGPSIGLSVGPSVTTFEFFLFRCVHASL